MVQNKYLLTERQCVYSFDNADAKEQHTTQYFEMFGNRAIYHDGWVAATRHSIPWVMAQLPHLAEDVWELYNVNEDFSQANNLASSNPEKLKELQAKFDEEATRIMFSQSMTDDQRDSIQLLLVVLM